MIVIRLNKDNKNLSLKINRPTLKLNQTGRPGRPGDPATNLVTSVNGKQGVVILNASDVNADPSGTATQALTDANEYTDTEISAIDTGVLSVIAGENVTIDNTDPKNPVVSSLGGGTGDVESVNGQTGIVELDTDNIDDTPTNRYTNDSDITRLANTSGTNTGDQTLSGLGGVPTTRTINGQDLSANRTLTQDNISDGTTYKQYSQTEKTKLAGIASGAQVNTVTSVAGKTGVVTLTKSDVGLSNVDNTSDINKPVSTAQADADTDVYNNAVFDAYSQADQLVSNAMNLLAEVAFSGNKADVGLGNVDNTSDANKPVSTAQQTALDAKANDNAVVKLAGSQTITGAKTFNAATLLDKGNTVFNVKAYGAVGNDSANDTAAIQAAIDAAGAVGGEVYFPPGTYRIQTNPLYLYNGSTPYSSIKLKGAGSGRSIIKQMTTGVDAIRGLNNATGYVQLLNFRMEALGIVFGGTPTNSGNGIYLKQNAAYGPSFQQAHFKDLVISNFQGAGKYGFNAESLIVSVIETVMVVDCANGFYLNGGAFGGYTSMNTSTSFISCYANGSTEGIGFNVTYSNYISFKSCASDNSATIGYVIEATVAVSYDGCGVEWGVSKAATAYKFINATQINMNACFAFVGATGTPAINAIWATSNSVVNVSGFKAFVAGTLTRGLLVDAGSRVTEINNSYIGDGTTTTVRSVAGTNIILDDQSGARNIATLAGNETLTNKTITAGSNTISGLAVANLGGITGTPSGTTYLRGDGTWATVSSGGSAITRSVVNTSGNFSMASAANTDYVYFVTGAHAGTLPAASGNTDQYTIINVHTSAITITRAGSDTIFTDILSQTNFSLNPGESVDLISNGTSVWKVI